MKFWTHRDLWFTLLIGLLIAAISWGSATMVKPSTPALMTQAEVQQHLVNAGYDVGPKGVDGHIGKDSRLAWDIYSMEK